MNSVTSIARGIQSVRAETSPEQVATAISALGASFAEFKAKHDARLGDVEKQMDKMATAEAGREMLGGASAEAAPLPGVRPMRTYAEFRRHYAPKAESKEEISVTDFVRGVAGMRTTDAVKAQLAVGSNTAGGYAVPAQTMPAILSALTPNSSLLQAGAGIVPMPDGAKSITTAAVDTIPQASWRLELGNIAESDPSFRPIVAVPHSLAFYFKVSRELLADAEGIETALQLAIGQAFAKALDYAGLLGSGTNPEPRGLLNVAGVQTVTNGANGAAAGYPMMLEAYQKLLTANAPAPTAAIMAPRSLIKLAGLVDTQGQPLRKPELLSTLPMVTTSQVPVNLAVGTSNDCSLMFIGDFSRMYFLVRESLSIQLLREQFATTGEIGFLCHVRADVVVNYPQAFAVISGVK